MFFQTDSRPRKSVPEKHRHEAAGAGNVAQHGETRDTARSGVLREFVRLLSGRERRA